MLILRNMNKPVNDSEEFVYQISHKSFLSLWSYANPRGKNSKELCDILIDKEDLYASGKQTVFDGSEEDLLGYYIHNGRSYPQDFDIIVVGSNIWNEIIKKPEYKAKKEADRDSYIWDRLLENISKDVLNNNLEFGPDLNQSELALRGMAREPRFARRILGKFFRDFMDLAAQRIIESRTLISPESNIAYVFLAKPHGEDRQYRVAELGGRCFVVRGLQQNCKTVIGIATEQYQPGQGFSFDIVYLRQETWTDENQKQLENAQKEFGWFTSPQQTSVHEDKYPIN